MLRHRPGKVGDMLPCADALQYNAFESHIGLANAAASRSQIGVLGDPCPRLVGLAPDATHKWHHTASQPACTSSDGRPVLQARRDLVMLGTVSHARLLPLDRLRGTPELAVDSSSLVH
jgi:hypothetical protein